MHTLFTNDIHAGGEMVCVPKRGITGRACLGSYSSPYASNTLETFFRHLLFEKTYELYHGEFLFVKRGLIARKNPGESLAIRRDRIARGQAFYLPPIVVYWLV